MYVAYSTKVRQKHKTRISKSHLRQSESLLRNLKSFTTLNTTPRNDNHINGKLLQVYETPLFHLL